MISLAGVPILSLIIFAPLVGALILAFVPGHEHPRREGGRPGHRAGHVRAVAASRSWASTSSDPGFQYQEKVSWIPFFGIKYQVGMDGISLLLVVLTTLLTWISILASFGPVKTRVKEYMIAFLALEVGMLGVFLALDLFLFYIFWEIVLVPMYLIIGIWGGANRIYATMKFVLYTLVGSLLMLVAILATAFAYQAATGHLGRGVRPADAAASFGFDTTFQLLCFVAFFLAFAIKVPMWPFHTWLPDAHVEAPTAGSVILAGVLLKLGGYGFIRFALPLYPQAAHDLAGIIVVLSLIAIIYGAIVAIVQPDLKKLVAYSSVSHMGFVTLGIFVFTQQGLQGAVVQMVTHGIITGALFLCVGVIYERTHDRTIAKMGGLASRTPVYAALFGFFMFASVGPARPRRVRGRVPGPRGHVPRLAARGRRRRPSRWSSRASTCCGCSSGSRSGSPASSCSSSGHHLTDIDRVEVLTLAPLFVLTIVIGVYPGHRARLHPGARERHPEPPERAHDGLAR